MIEYWSVIGPVVGGIIAAVSGFGTYILESKDREKKQREQWERRLVRLCERINLEPGELDTNIQYEYRYTDVQPLIEDHLSSAPEGVKNKIFEIYEEEIYPLKYIYQVGAKGTTRKPDDDDINNLSEAAQKIISRIEDRDEESFEK